MRKFGWDVLGVRRRVGLEVGVEGDVVVIRVMML